jgi:hypothetical protein
MRMPRPGERPLKARRATGTAMFKGLFAQRLAAVFVAGWLLFSFPLLGVWDRDVTVWGVPLFPAALFVLWLGLIAVLAWWMERSPQEPGDL